LQRTVKAYSFVAGKKVQNQTEIAKCTYAEEQTNPIRVVYVRPGMNKPAPLVRQKADTTSKVQPLNTKNVAANPDQ